MLSRSSEPSIGWHRVMKMPWRRPLAVCGRACGTRAGDGAQTGPRPVLDPPRPLTTGGSQNNRACSFEPAKKMTRGLASIEDDRSVFEAERVRGGRPQTMPDLNVRHYLRTDISLFGLAVTPGEKGNHRDQDP